MHLFINFLICTKLLWLCNVSALYGNITTAASAALIDPHLPERFVSLSSSDTGEFAVHGFKMYLFKGTVLSNLTLLFLQKKLHNIVCFLFENDRVNTVNYQTVI